MRTAPPVPNSCATSRTFSSRQYQLRPGTRPAPHKTRFWELSFCKSLLVHASHSFRIRIRYWYSGLSGFRLYKHRQNRTFSFCDPEYFLRKQNQAKTKGQCLRKVSPSLACSALGKPVLSIFPSISAKGTFLAETPEFLCRTSTLPPFLIHVFSRTFCQGFLPPSR